MKEDYQKAFKKVTLNFLWNPVPFNSRNYQKQKGPETSDQSLFRLRNKIRKIPLLVMYYLTKFDDVIIKGLVMCVATPSTLRETIDKNKKIKIKRLAAHY